MKLNIFSFLVFAFLFSQNVFAQTGKQMPSADIQTIDGVATNSNVFDNEGNPIIISFWATWCKPCILELSTILEDYEDLQDETGVKLIAISIDDMRNKSKVKPFINGRDWPYEVYLDPNSNLKRAMNVNNVPHTFVLNGDKKIVWEHNSYSPGDEEELFEIVEQVKNGELEGDH